MAAVRCVKVYNTIMNQHCKSREEGTLAQISEAKEGFLEKNDLDFED